jgi:hypothetical protein
MKIIVSSTIEKKVLLKLTAPSISHLQERKLSFVVPLKIARFFPVKSLEYLGG